MELICEKIPQEHPMGCAAACVAFCGGINYQTALKLFSTPEHAWTRGFYCDEVVEALANLGKSYKYSIYKDAEHSKYLQIPGTIAFVNPCESYPGGHFLARDARGWMNPWSTFPLMIPVEAEFQESLPGPVGYIIYQV